MKRIEVFSWQSSVFSAGLLEPLVDEAGWSADCADLTDSVAVVWSACGSTPLCGWLGLTSAVGFHRF